jgi:cytochrome c-type biogenesis protein CcmH
MRLLLTFCFCAAMAHAAPDADTRVRDIAAELRCLVCQNQSIADSNASLAVDLRRQIREQVAQGKSDDDIRAYMTARYGDFVLYRPPLKATTALLWLGPFLLLLIAAGIFLRLVRRQGVGPEKGQGPALDDLLKG